MNKFLQALNRVNYFIEECKDVEELFINDEYQKSLKVVKKYSDIGNSEALSCLGVVYQLGLGLDRNLKLAIELLSKEAEKGNGKAAHNLGTLYLTCKPDMPYDPQKSKYWYRKAKELGFVIADEDFYESTNGKTNE